MFGINIHHRNQPSRCETQASDVEPIQKRLKQVYTWKSSSGGWKKKTNVICTHIHIYIYIFIVHIHYTHTTDRYTNIYICTYIITYIFLIGPLHHLLPFAFSSLGVFWFFFLLLNKYGGNHIRLRFSQSFNWATWSSMVKSLEVQSTKQAVAGF